MAPCRRRSRLVEQLGLMISCMPTWHVGEGVGRSCLVTEILTAYSLVFMPLGLKLGGFGTYSCTWRPI